MGADVVRLAALALSLPVLSLCDPLFALTAPNVLRLGTKENVFVEVQEYDGKTLQVEIRVKDFPANQVLILSQTVTLSKEKNFQHMQDILIPERYFDPKKKQYVHLQAIFPDHEVEQVVLVSFQPGYLFVQTDKPIYNPEDIVNYRVFAMNPGLEPITDGVTVEIMNPDGITLEHEFLYPPNGVKSSNYKLPEIPRLGTWKIVCGFGKSRDNLFTGEFEVKEYVLPSFEVKLTPRRMFFHVEDAELIVDISAKYLYGNAVSGKAFVVFGVLMDKDEKRSIPASLDKVILNSGKGTAKLTRQQILTTFENIGQLVGLSLYVSFSLMTGSGSGIVDTERRGILIVTSPYTIHFKKTPTYFKPGMPFHALVYVTNPDGTPAKGIALEELGTKSLGTTNRNGVAKFSINTPEGISTLSITVETKVDGLSTEQQAKRQMQAQAYKPQEGSNNYLHISVLGNEFKNGDNLDIHFDILTSPGAKEKTFDLTYLVISKGRLIRANRYNRKNVQMIALKEKVTKDMLPSFRIVAYYHMDKEVVSDSVWVDVKDTCMGTLKVTSEDKIMHRPNFPLTFTITGDPGAKVGLVSVDKGVYVLNNKHRLTQTKIWDIVEKQDIGCTTGSGRDSMGVFYDAGLVFVSNDGGTTARADPECPVLPSRRRRSLELTEVKHSLVRNYEGQLRKCCTDGMVANPMGYTCDRRAMFIEEGEECRAAFVHCCSEVEKKSKEARAGELILARSEEQYDDVKAFDEITPRTTFPESWLWTEIDLPACPDENSKCETTSVQKESLMGGSITTWEVTAVSVSKDYGICVSDPFEMKVTKDFFIDLKLPYAAVRNEQLEIKAVLHNYYPFEITARVQLFETKDVCSTARGKRKSIEMVTIDEMSSRAVPFVIVPMAIAGGIQSDTISPVDLKHIVPGTHPETHISVTGQLLGQSINAAINGEFVTHLIQQPGGCGEQNMMTMTGPVIATHYLDKTQQWEKAGLDRRAEAIKHIKHGYNRQLGYRQSDGSYHVFSKTKSSTWLTAYVAKVLGMAYNLITVGEDVICSALKWLVLNAQQPNGMFLEFGQIYQSEMMGGVKDNDPKVALTAFVLIAMQESSHICVTRVASLPGSMRQAKEFLLRNIRTLTNTYAVALTSYALANERLHHLDILNRFSNDKTSWRVSGNHHFTLEATGYALMALVKASQFDQAAHVVKWLTEQGFYGSFGSTQATVIVFQAIALYMTESPAKSPTNLTVTLSVASRIKPEKWFYNRDTMHITRSTKDRGNEKIAFNATGTGQGTLSVMTIYQALQEDDEADCTDFNLEVKLEKQTTVTYPLAQETYMLRINMMYKSFKRDSTMSILDISMPTGFTADEAELKLLTSGMDQYIKKIEMDTKLSEKGSIILYLNKVSHRLSDQIAFKIHKINNVGLLQPAAVTLYEYNSKESHCTKFYHPEKKDGALKRICREDVCRCAEEHCRYKKKDEPRAITACSSDMDYVYKAKVMEAHRTLTHDRFTLLVMTTIKEGTDSAVEGKNRTYLAHIECRGPIDLIEGRTYLIMGPFSSLAYQDRGAVGPHGSTLTPRVDYILSGHTYIEYWPTDSECQEEKFLTTCKDIVEATENVRTNGCTA
ncbi:hypothetical protein COCON_G00023560 [Conger conger]|uniref:Uncharacterized protein n=1 Tax=Conger conger TaxID=82655 RepID=A0A9Q1DX94_CONCO|nr:hypothetical protein COCON_G00023560 [Conger conger]